VIPVKNSLKNKKTIFLLISLSVILSIIISPFVSCKTAVELSGNDQVLNLADTGPITLDPATAMESSSAMYILQLFSGLVRLDENLNVIPDIAYNWDKSEDGKIYTFHLRENAKFHDGKPVTAGDFKYSWERALNPATGSMTAGTYLNDIKGADDILKGKTTQLTGVTVINDHTLQVELDSPKAYFLYKMAYPTAFVLDKSNVESSKTWYQKPNGTGPFKLKKWEKDNLLILERNDLYYDTKAKLKQIIFNLYSGNSIQLYQQGQIDVAGVSSSYIGMVTDPANSISRELEVYPELSLFYIGFNVSEPPFDDVKVRQAFCCAIDKERLISLSTQNTVTPAYGILPPGMPGYNNLKLWQYDPQKAKELISESKYGSTANLPPIVVTTSGMGGNISGILGGVIEEWRRNLGIEVTVRQLEAEAYFYYLNEEKDQMFETGWIADYPDPQDFLDVLFRTGSSNNSCGYSNLEIDNLLDIAAVEQNPEKRLKMYEEIEKKIVEEAPIIPIFFSKSYVLVRPYVLGYTQSPLGYPLFSKISIQK